MLNIKKVDRQLIKGCINNNRRIQKKLYDKFSDDMFSLCFRYISNTEDSEDVLIKAFTKVFENIKKFEYRGDGSLKKWIKTIMINESLMFLRAKKKLFFEEIDTKIENNSISAESEMSYNEIINLVEKMPTGYRTVFNLYSIEGYSHKEISELLSIKINTSKSQLHKAKKYMQKQIKSVKL